MFYLERTWENLSKQERYQLRQEKLKPLMQEFFNWCEKNKTTVLPGSKLGKAINYTLKHQETFEHILLDGNLELSNNKAERAVKSLVMGRKNWLFSQSFKGATVSSIILSLIETAKRNKLDLEKYLNYLLQKLPNEEILESDALEVYLPWQEKIQASCKQKNRLSITVTETVFKYTSLFDAYIERTAFGYSNFTNLLTRIRLGENLCKEKEPNNLLRLYDKSC